MKAYCYFKQFQVSRFEFQGQKQTLPRISGIVTDNTNEVHGKVPPLRFATVGMTVRESWARASNLITRRTQRFHKGHEAEAQVCNLIAEL
jgi:hypothetical protein